jgi:hypothetical protein
MTTTNEQKPNPDTRYVKQGVPQGDFASGERTTPTLPEVENFASGEQMLPTSTTVGDFASGEHALPTSTAVEDFASGEHALPTVPEHPDLADTLPPVSVATGHKE